MSIQSDEYPYLGEYIYIRSLSSQKYQAFVTKFSNSSGSDAWSDIPGSFDDDGKWTRHGWDLAAIRNSGDTDRRGYYVNAKNQTVYITVRSLGDIKVVITKRPE